MRTKEELDRLRERAIALRREGESLRAKARELRAEGLNYNQITARLGVSKSSVSLWVRDLPVPPRLSYEENRRRSAEGARQYWATERKAREARRENERAAAVAEIGGLTAREILIAGAIAYWCEGAKAKPHRQLYCVVFVNSDPGLARTTTGAFGLPSIKAVPSCGRSRAGRRRSWQSRHKRMVRYRTFSSRRRTGCAARATAAACGSTSGEAAIYTAGSRAGLLAPCSASA